MSHRNNPGAGRLIVTAVAIAVCSIGLTACRDDFLDRRDTVTLGVGDSIAHNKAVQTRDPWPATANSRNATTRGDQVQKVQEEFLKRDRYDQSRGNGRSAIKEQ